MHESHWVLGAFPTGQRSNYRPWGKIIYMSTHNCWSSGKPQIFSLCRNLWCPHETLVVLGLLDEVTPQDIRQDMAAALRQTQQPARFPTGETMFSTKFLRDGESSLASFIELKSWHMFHLLWCRCLRYGQRILDMWHRVPLCEWSHCGDWLCPECFIKVIRDCANVSKDSDYKNGVILVSASHQTKLQSFLKNEIDGNV